jgi:hypothetical protein
LDFPSSGPGESWLAPDITTAIIKWPKTAATHRQDIDAPDAAAAD